MGPMGPAPATQISQPHLVDPVSTAYTEDLIPDLTTQKPPPRTVPYQPPSFNLDRPTKWLTKEERLEVHHNYIPAVSNLEHKKDLINRLKRSEPHNIPTYEAETTHHMALHNDVLGRIHTILKQDDYFRTLKELPAIDGLHACDDIQLFPELFDMPAVIGRITSKADLIEKQLNKSTPEATVPDTPEEKIPKSLNGEGVKNSRKQATTSTTTTQDSRLCFRCKQPGHLKKDCPELPYCSKCRTQGHILAKCPTKQQDNRQQDKRCKSTDERCKKLTEKIGRNHRTDHSSPTIPTNALTVQVIMELGIVQQDSNHTHLPLATQLMAQVLQK